MIWFLGQKKTYVSALNDIVKCQSDLYNLDLGTSLDVSDLMNARRLSKEVQSELELKNIAVDLIDWWE